METTAGRPTMEGVRNRRAGLHHILIELETAISAAAPGREDEWADQVRVALSRLTDAFADHIKLTEGPDGLFEAIRNSVPRLDMRCRRLEREHAAISASLSEVEATLDRGTDDVRDSALKLLAQLSRHRQHGADLVYEAYEVDLGGSD